MKFYKQLSLSVLPVVLLTVFSSAKAYTPIAEQVTENVYALIGPLVQRSMENDGLNNNLGFIVTQTGVILIDSGASYIGAQRIEKAIQAVTQKPIKWVINTGSQDHRWLGNDYFAEKGAKIIALEQTAMTQAKFSVEHMEKMLGFLKERFKGTRPLPATELVQGDNVQLQLDEHLLELRYTHAHYPGDIWVWLPEQSVLFSGDLVYVDRMFTIHTWSSVTNGQLAFKEMLKLKPEYIVPGHGGISDMNKAIRDCGNYYDFLINNIGSAADEMEPLDEVITKYRDIQAFRHLKHYDSLHRLNMSRTYLEFEQK